MKGFFCPICIKKLPNLLINNRKEFVLCLFVSKVQFKIVKMKWSVLLKVFCNILFVVGITANLGDPYKILGVERYANLQEIRKAYKQLAKEW